MRNMLNIAGFLLIVLLVSSCSCAAQEAYLENLPDDILMEFATGSFAQAYLVDARINPFYLRGDFDGDGKADYAILIAAKKDGAKGIGIWLSSQKRVYVIGAGHTFKFTVGQSADLKLLNTWQVYGKKSVEQGVGGEAPPKLIGEAILAGKRESASGLIYWNGKQFAWYQQGD
jgi:hypothetical protein